MAYTATSEHALPPPAVAAVKRQSLFSAYVELFKVRVSVMVLITAAAGIYLGRLRSGVSPFDLQSLYAILGIAVVTLGSSALNQALERRSDARMMRTRNRPMVVGPDGFARISLPHGLIVGFIAIFGGSLFLAAKTNLLTGTLTLLTAIGYVAIYTPLKRITTFNTFIGAFPGALPPLLGWTAARGLIEWPAVALFAVIFVWQFPHFMAIGWMYRDDYRHGGIRLAATQQPITWAARSTVFQALFYAVLMIPTALWTTFLGVTGTPYAIVATVLSLGYLGFTIRFARILRNPSDPSTRKDARNLLTVSVIYLPLLLAAMILNAQGHLIF